MGREGIKAVGYPSFDEAFAVSRRSVFHFLFFFFCLGCGGGVKATSEGKAQLLLVPIENTLGGTIHANCDLQLQHNLFIIVPSLFCFLALAA